MQFAFLGKQVLRMGMTFRVFERFLSLFLCLFIKGIFISEQSDIKKVKINAGKIERRFGVVMTPFSSSIFSYYS